MKNLFLNFEKGKKMQTKLAEKIRSERFSRSWSQAQLSEISGLSERTIQRVEKSGNCSKETLLAIASAFDLDVQEFTCLFETQENFFDFNGSKILAPERSYTLGLVLAFPAVYFIFSNILKYQFGIHFFAKPWEFFYNDPKIFTIFNFVSPIIFLGGLSLAILLNFGSLLKFHLRKTPNELISTINLKANFLNLSIIGIGFTSIIFLICYVIFENLNHL